MKISKQARRDAKQLFRTCVKDGRLDEEIARKTAQKIVEIRPRGFLAILTHFHRLIKLEIERRTAHVQSAAPLAEGLKQDVQNNLARAYGPGLHFEFQHDPSLVGGLRIQVGSDVYDGSVKARLEALEEKF